MKFRFSPDFVIDSDAEPFCREGLRIGNFGGPGSGKSHNNALVIEQFLTQGGTVVIFQPRDEYFTLKEKFDILSVGGVHAKDIDFALTSPATYAKAVVENGISMIFYTSDVEDEDKLVDWVSRFFQAIMKLEEVYHRPLMVIPEESHEYLPNNPKGHVCAPWTYNRMIKAFKDLSTQGRKLNIIAVVSSQRPQEVNFTIRQLCNVTFYGKFGSQDIKYIDKECLTYVRKLGVEIESERLVQLSKGEWLVIQGSQSRFIVVTEPRLTKHGADTPSLEYVAPRASAVKQTVDELAKSIMDALAKEQAEGSELEKAKRKLHDTEKKLEESEKKANIKMSLQEMMKPSTPAPVKASVDKAEFEVEKRKREVAEKELKEKRAELEKTTVIMVAAVSEADLNGYSRGRVDAETEMQKKIEFLELKEKGFKERIEQAEKDLKVFDELRSWLRITLNIQNIYDNIHRVEEKIPTMLPTALPASLPSADGAATVAVTECIPEIQHKIERPTVETNELSGNDGRLITLVLNGFFDEKRRLGEMAKEIDRRFAVIVSNYKRDLVPALERLIQLKVLQREEESGKGGYVYWLEAGAKDRIKEAS